MIYEELGIDPTRLKRDYIKNPLIKGKSYHPGERPIKDDMVYLYLELKLPINKIAKLFNVSCAFVEKFCLKDYNIRKYKSQHNGTLLSKDFYNTYLIDVSRLSRDYFILPLKLHLGKHDSERPTKKDIEYLFIEKNIRAQLVANYFNTNIATLRKWCKYYHIKKTYKNMLINSRKTLKIKYGVENVSNIPEIVERRFITRTVHNTHNTSKAEDSIYILLKEKFSKIERQYKSERYPFACDFYIPEKDLYIEYQGNWTHGKEPYDENKDEHRALINKWKNKAKEINFKNQHKKQYLEAIEVWTIRDPLKRKTAKENNLNWIEFFNLKEFEDWFKKIN